MGLPPPRILALDTATLPASVAVVGDGAAVSGDGAAPLQHVQQDDRRTDAWVGTAVMECLREAGLGVADLDGLACSVGPGTFTGIRVGIATALGMAAPRGLPVAGIRTLDALALLGLQRAAIVVACIDARRGQVYAALYERGAEDSALLPLPTAWGPAVCQPEEVADLLASRSPAPLLIGSGAGLIDAPSPGPPALAAAIGALAVRAWNGGGGSPSAWPSPEPVYLRPPDATPPENPLLRARR